MKGRRFGVGGVVGKPTILPLVPLCVCVCVVCICVCASECEKERDIELLTSPVAISRDLPA